MLVVALAKMADQARVSLYQELHAAVSAHNSNMDVNNGAGGGQQGIMAMDVNNSEEAVQQQDNLAEVVAVLQHVLDLGEQHAL